MPKTLLSQEPPQAEEAGEVQTRRLRSIFFGVPGEVTPTTDVDTDRNRRTLEDDHGFQGYSDPLGYVTSLLPFVITLVLVIITVVIVHRKYLTVETQPVTRFYQRTECRRVTPIRASNRGKESPFDSVLAQGRTPICLPFMSSVLHSVCYRRS